VLLGSDVFQNECYRISVPLKQVSQDLVDATVAAEDESFYENKGVDIPSILRAGKQYVQYGYIVSAAARSPSS